MRNRFHTRYVCVCMVLLLCLTITTLQTNAIIPSNSGSYSPTVLPIGDHETSPTIDTASATASQSGFTASIDIGNPISYNSVSSTATSSSPDPRMPTSDNCVYSFQNVASGKYATSTDNSLYAEVYQNIYQTFDNTSMAQHFRLKDAGDGYYYIVPLENNGSEGRMMCAKLQNHIGFVENVFYCEYSDDSEYEFRWRFEFIETPDNRVDCFAIFLGDSDYALTSMTNGNGSYDRNGTNPVQSYHLQGNICVTSYNRVANYSTGGYTFTEGHQLWRLSSGQRELYYGYNVRNASQLNIAANEINLHISYPVTAYGDTCSITSTITNVLDINSTDLSVQPDLNPGYTTLIACTYDSNGAFKEIMTKATYVYLPDGTYYFADSFDSHVLSVTSSQPAIFNAYDGNEPTHSRLLYDLIYIGGGQYCIRSDYSSSSVWGIQNNELKLIGIGLIGSYTAIDPSMRWTIEASDGKYRIYNASSNNASLTIPSPLSDGSSLCLSPRSYSDTNQLWSIQRVLKLTGNELPYNPTLWNDPIVNNPDLSSHIQYFTNCYSYAYNNQTQYALRHASIKPNGLSAAGSMQPGMLGGIGITDNIISKHDLLELLEYDKNASGGIILIKANSVNPSPEDGYRVALWYDVYSYDYHWYRQNPNGTWSHKPGDYEVTNVDTHGNLIVDAQNQHTLYSTFVGYYYAVPFNVISSLESAPTQIIDVIGFYPDDFS